MYADSPATAVFTQSYLHSKLLVFAKRDGLSMLLVLDLLSTFCFACVGASIALRLRMNVSAVFLSAMLPAIGGGTVREFLLGSHCVFWLETPSYLLVVIIAILVVVLLGRITNFPEFLCRLFDAIGTSVFIMVGVLAAINSGCNPLTVFLMGLLTGIGGGIIREILFDRRTLVQNPMKIVFGATTALMCSTLVLMGADVVSTILLLALIHFLQGQFYIKTLWPTARRNKAKQGCGIKPNRVDIVL